MKKIIICVLISVLVSFSISYFFKNAYGSFSVYIFAIGLLLMYFGAGTQPGRPGMPAHGGGNRDVSPHNQAMMTEMTALGNGSKYDKNYDRSVFYSGVICLLIGIVFMLLKK